MYCCNFSYDGAEYMEEKLKLPELNINAYQSWKSAIRLLSKRMSVMSLILYFLLIRYKTCPLQIGQNADRHVFPLV